MKSSSAVMHIQTLFLVTPLRAGTQQHTQQSSAELYLVVMYQAKRYFCLRPTAKLSAEGLESTF
jgi:hypothetical protein